MHLSVLSIQRYLCGPCPHRPQGVVLKGASTQAVLVQEQFEVVLRLPLAEPFLYRWRLLEPLTLVCGDAIDILWGSDDVRCQEDEQVGLAF